MTKKILLTIAAMILVLVVAACNRNLQDVSDVQEPSHVSSVQNEAYPTDTVTQFPVPEPSYESIDIEDLANDEELAYGNGILFNLPKSTDYNIFGNRFNNSNIVFNTSTGYYYVSQLHYISHWYSDFGINDLAFKTRMDAELTTRTILSYGSFEQLQFIDGHMYYISNGLLMRYHNGTEEVIIDIAIDDYAIDGSLVYFVPVDTLEIWVKDMADNEPARMLPIRRTGMFQVAAGKVFFLRDDVIRMYSDNTTKVIYWSELGIQDFLIDGVILYRDNRRGLRMAGRDEIIGEFVDAYTIFDGMVYYARRNSVYSFDLTHGTTEQLLIGTGVTSSENIISIAVINNKLFLKNHIFLGGVHFLSVSELNGDNLRPVVSINMQQPEFQTFFFADQCLTFSYPIGFIVGDNGGSWRGCCLWLVYPESGLTIWIHNSKIYCEYRGASEWWEEFDVHAEGYTTMRTNQGLLGRYRMYTSWFIDDGINFVFAATDGVHGVSMVTDVYSEVFEEFKPILFEIARSLTITCYEINR